MSDFERGDRVQDCIWDGAYTGTVTNVDGNLVRVRWDDSIVEDDMYAKDIVLLAGAAVTR